MAVALDVVGDVDRVDDVIPLASLLGALSYALDLTEGQPVGHCIRSTWIGMRIGRAMGLPEMQLWELYYTVMLKDLNCSSNAARICELYLSEDIAFKRDSNTLGDSLPKVLGFVLSHTGRRSKLGERLRAILNIVQNGEAIVDDLIQTRCHRGAEIAASLRFSPSVSNGIRSLDEHWNGEGRPDRLAGSVIPLYSRIALLAQVVDVFHTAAGPEAALAEARSRAGNWFDPHAVACLEHAAADTDFWTTLASEAVTEAVLALEPGRSSIRVDESYLDDIARAFAQIVDSKSPFTSGHSERVSIYADMVAVELGYPAERRRWLRRAALLHDIGKLGVSNAILDKNGKLDEDEWREMRNHAALSESILDRVPVFREMARIGGGHHERLDGTGYPKGLTGVKIEPDTRIVSIADVFDALTADRPYRAAMPVAKALGIMRRCWDRLRCTLLHGAGTGGRDDRGRPRPGRLSDDRRWFARRVDDANHRPTAARHLFRNRVEWSEGVFAIHEMEGGPAPALDKALDFYKQPDRDVLAAKVATTVETGEPFEMDADFVTAKGRWRRVRVSCEIELSRGKPVALIGVIQDISDRHLMEETLRHQARTDSLTGLANRAEFHRVLDTRLREARSAGSELAVLLIDLDGFKGLNDSLGHAAGDDVLRQVADQLRQSCYEGWLPARLGGDEFAAVVPACMTYDSLAPMVDQLLRDLDIVTSVTGHIARVTGTVGIAWSGATDGHADALLRQADSALYAAKRTRKGTAQTYRSSELAVELAG